MSRFWSPIVKALTPYVAGEQSRIRDVVKLNTNENPYGPSPHALAAISEEVTDALRLYPDPTAFRLRAEIAESHGINPDQVFVNAVVRRLHPQPEFILFPGDEIIGLTPDAETLRAQWRYWFETEMAWLDRATTPIWHTTGNHTAYDRMSEGVFREVLRLPDNGPSGQSGLSYYVRRDDLLMVFVHTLWTGAGGEGHVETEWLEATLKDHKDARHKLVLETALDVGHLAGQLCHITRCSCPTKASIKRTGLPGPT